jgi:threonine dehydrogenase-like Zn-dependent dehydrogenase
MKATVYYAPGDVRVETVPASAIEQTQQMTKGEAEAVMECVGTAPSLSTAMGAARSDASIGFVGVPHGSEGVKPP